MCLALPARVISINDVKGQLIEVEQFGVRTEVCATPLLTRGETLEMLIDKWVLLHQGFAIQRISSEDAMLTLEALNSVIDTEKRPEVSEFYQKQWLN